MLWLLQPVFILLPLKAVTIDFFSFFFFLPSPTTIVKLSVVFLSLLAGTPPSHPQPGCLNEDGLLTQVLKFG